MIATTGAVVDREMSRVEGVRWNSNGRKEFMSDN